MASETITQVLVDQAARHPERPAFSVTDPRGETTTISYGELLARSLELATSLQERGLRRGDRVLICLPTSSEVLSSFYGTLLAGGVCVPVYPPLSPRGLGRWKRRVEAIARVAQPCGAIMASQGRLHMAAVLEQHGQDLFTVSPDQLKDRGRGEPEEVEPGDLAFIQFTSHPPASPRPRSTTRARSSSGRWTPWPRAAATIRPAPTTTTCRSPTPWPRPWPCRPCSLRTPSSAHRAASGSITMTARCARRCRPTSPGTRAPTSSSRRASGAHTTSTNRWEAWPTWAWRSSPNRQSTRPSSRRSTWTAGWAARSTACCSSSRPTEHDTRQVPDEVTGELREQVCELLGHRPLQSLYVSPDRADHEVFMHSPFSFDRQTVDRCIDAGHRAYTSSMERSPEFLQALDAAIGRQ